MYSQVMYCLDRVPDLVKKKPELRTIAAKVTLLVL